MLRNSYSLDVIAQPVFGAAERNWLLPFQHAHGENTLSPHFTLVLPGSDLEPHAYIAQVRAALGDAKRIPFFLRSAIVVSDPQVRAHHVFLVPDEGFGAIVRLHGRLHAGALRPCLQPGFPYIPHLTASSHHDFEDAQKIADKLNAACFEIGGKIEELELRRREAVVVHCIARIPLVKLGLFG